MKKRSIPHVVEMNHRSLRNMPVIVAPRWRMLAGIALCSTVLWLGCEPSQASPGMAADSTGMQAVDSAWVSQDSSQMDPTVEEGSGSKLPMKSATEIAALEAMWAKARQAEHKFLLSDRLAAMLQKANASRKPDEQFRNKALSDPEFASLTAKEKLAYTMYHPEEWSQNCKISQASQAGKILAISRKIPYGEGETESSERQWEALKKDSVAVKKAVVESIETNQAVSASMLHLIAHFKMRVAILPLIQLYQRQEPKDDLILTCLIELMENANYWTWTYSQTFKDMLADPNQTMPITQANIDAIIEMARNLAAK